MTYGEFYDLPVIKAAFPLLFKGSKAQWTEYIVHCNDCSEKIPAEETRGRVAFTEGTKTLARGYIIEAYALCPDCDRMSTVRQILHEDMTMTQFEKDGDVSRFATRKVEWWEPVLDAVLEFFESLREILAGFFEVLDRAPRMN